LIVSTHAIVLNKKNYSDSSLICDLFSKDYGKVTIIAKGAKSIKNPLGALLQPLNYIECIYYYKSSRNIQILKEASIINKYYTIENDYKKMQYGLTVVDLINQINYVEYPSDIIFRLTYKVLESLDNVKNKYIDVLFIFFLLQYLIYLGYRPSVKKCIQCNKKIVSGKFDYSIGQITCNTCSNSNLIIDTESLSIIKFLMETHLTKIVKNFDFDLKKCTQINYFLYKFVLFHVPDIKKSKALKGLYNVK
jgi:DNA repair protein RecO (recombination protein O)